MIVHRLYLAHDLHRMHNGHMDDTELSLIDPDDGSWPTPPPPEPAGHVDVTVRLSDGSVWRVATTREQIKLTVAGPDGMATLTLSDGDAEILADALQAGQLDLRRFRMGNSW